MPEVLVTASVVVPVDPDEAFRIFTEEYDAWWVRSPTTFHDGARAREMRMEPGVGGRLLEVYDDDPLDALELGRIREWEPGKRLVYTSIDETEASFTFEAEGAATRVSVDVRPLPGRDPARPVAGTQKAMLEFFSARAADPRHASWSGRDLPRVLPMVEYRDPAGAARWLIDVFGLEGLPPRSGEFPADFPISLSCAGGGVIVLGHDEGPVASGGARVYAYVDDLEAHFARVQAAGARIVRPIRAYGDRNYVAEDLEGNHWTFAQARPAQR